MKVCGIEIKGNDAILVCLAGDKDNYQIISPELKKISLKESSNQNDVRAFSTAMATFFNTMNFDKIAIKARATKGKFAGGAVSFKMEGLIQNTASEVELIHGATTKAKLGGILFDTAVVNKYQVEALKLAITLLS
ncbi:MAG: DUF3010 family protein [Saprospiraceae bacterium]